MTTCSRFDRDEATMTCRTCGRAIVFTPSRRKNAHPSDGGWQHAGVSVAQQLASLELKRRAAK